MTMSNTPGQAYDSVILSGRVLAVVHVILGVIASFSVWNFRGPPPASEPLPSWRRAGHDPFVRIGLGPLFAFLDPFANCFGRQPARSRGFQYCGHWHYRCGGWPLFLSATIAGGCDFWWRGGLVAPCGQGVRADVAARMAGEAP